jgi:poly(beta-D-mannuronate) lyase
MRCALSSSILGLTLLVWPVPYSRASDLLHVKNSKASFLDVTKRRQELAGATNPRLLTAIHDTKSCLSQEPVPPPSGQIEIPRRYVDGGHGKVDPKESQMSQPYYRIQHLAAEGANSYLISGDHRESACVLNALDDWAKADTLMHYDAQTDSQAWAQVGWTIASLALSVSVIDEDAALDPAKLGRVIAWLHRAAEKDVSEKKTKGELRGNSNNLSYWRGLAATATGVISGDDKLFTFGIEQYQRAIGQMSSDGSWPLEMEREELAVHYQTFALQPLVMIAELAARQGFDCYGYSTHGHTLRNAVDFLAASIDDPGIARKHAGVEQKIDIGEEDFFCWLEFWNARFDSAGLAKYLDRPWFTSRLSGSTTLYAAPLKQ